MIIYVPLAQPYHSDEIPSQIIAFCLPKFPVPFQLDMRFFSHYLFLGVVSNCCLEAMLQWVRDLLTLSLLYLFPEGMLILNLIFLKYFRKNCSKCWQNIAFFAVSMSLIL